LNVKGLKTVSVADFQKLKEGKVLVRAHGEPPETFQKAADAGINLIDGTCPIVKRLQQKILRRYQELDPQKEHIVIFGKVGHPETVGLLGQTNNEAILVTNPGMIDHVPPRKKTYLYSQTTMDPEAFDRLVNLLKEKPEVEAQSDLVAECTICRQMKNRKPDLASFTKKCDVLIFVSGKESSNGKMLFEYARSFTDSVYWIEDPEQLEPEWVINAGFIGISGATSTPLWQLEQVRNHIQSLTGG
jgi:4-hydroxy-3-methylbut-2-enyl diphosphate reductase